MWRVLLPLLLGAIHIRAQNDDGDDTTTEKCFEDNEGQTMLGMSPYLRSYSMLPVKAINEEPFPRLARNEDLNLAPEGRSDDVNCGEALVDLKVGSTGVITTPNYPRNYPSKAKCVWWLKSEPKSIISITCDDAETEECEGGFLDYALVSPEWLWEEYYLICGSMNQKSPFALTSLSNEMAVFFRSSKFVNKRGIHCIYKVSAIGTAPPSDTSSAQLVTSTDTITPANEPDEEKGYNGEDLCGEAPLVDDTRIVGGQVTKPHEFPWMVGISFNDTWFCGGTLLSPRWVLTAAHCTTNAKVAEVYIGAHKFEQGREELKTTHFINHPGYRMDAIANDVALVKLPKEVEYSPKIRPACLPLRASRSKDLTGLTMIATGWGKTRDNSALSPVLRKLVVRVTSSENCRKSYGNIVQDTNMCAIGVLAHSGTCQGDSGSALQHQVRRNKWIQEGIISFGSITGCGTNYPNGYSRIAAYLDFISQHTGLKFN